MEMNINELSAKVHEHTAEAASLMAKRNDLQPRIEQTKADLMERKSAVSKSEAGLRQAIIQGDGSESHAREDLAKARREFSEAEERLEVITREFDSLNAGQPWLSHQRSAEHLQKRLWQGIRKLEMEKVAKIVIPALHRVHAASLLAGGDGLVNTAMSGTLNDFLGANTPSEAGVKDLQEDLASNYGITLRK